MLGDFGPPRDQHVNLTESDKATRERKRLMLQRKKDKRKKATNSRQKNRN